MEVSDEVFESRASIVFDQAETRTHHQSDPGRDDGLTAAGTRRGQRTVMLIVDALGGNALLRRGEPMTANTQRQNVRIAARALAPLARQNQLVPHLLTSPQVGLLALQASAYESVEPYRWISWVRRLRA